MKSPKNIFIFLILLAFACGESEEPALVEELTFGELSLADLENTGNATDINLALSLEGSIAALTEMRVFLIKADGVVDKEAALQSTFSQTILPGRNIDIFLDATLMDTDGEVVNEGVPYQVVVEGTFPSGTTFSSELSNVLTLKNEIVLTTPVLQGNFNGMEDIIIDEQGQLYVAGGGTAPNTVYKITPGGNSTVFSSGHQQPVGIDIDLEGNIYVSNLNATTIQKITPVGTVSTFVSDEKLTGGGGIAIDEEGTLYNAFFAGTTLFRIKDGVLEEWITDESLRGLVGMTYDPEEDKLYAANFNSGTILHIKEDGTMTQIVDTPLSIGHVAYKDGFFYATGWHEHQVMQISLDGEITATIGISGVMGDQDGSDQATFNSPNGIAVSPDGKYVYVSQGNGKLRKIVLTRSN